ncbi:MAG: cupin domain-containing protein [Pseudomonadota bacterium]
MCASFTPTKGTATGRIVEENDRIIIWEWSFEAGQNTGWHRHEHDYVVVPMVDGAVRVVDKDGETVSEMRTGIPYFRESGVEHDVINATDGPYRFLEIELKQA